MNEMAGMAIFVVIFGVLGLLLVVTQDMRNNKWWDE